MRKLLFILPLVLLIGSASAQPISRGRLEITEEDASPSVFPYQLRFTNGAVTDNGDGTASVSLSAGSGNVTNSGGATANNITVFNNTDGTQIKDSGVPFSAIWNWTRDRDGGGYDLENVTNVNATNGTFTNINGINAKNLGIQFTIEDPDQLADVPAMRNTHSTVVFSNTRTTNYTINYIGSITDVDDYNFSFYKSANWTDINVTNDVLMQTILVADNGDGCFYNNTTSMTNATLEPGKHLIFEHNQENATRIHIAINGTFE